MKEIVIYVHGKGGSAAEAGHYRPLFPDAEVVGFDYRAQARSFPCPRWMQRWSTGRIGSRL